MLSRFKYLFGIACLVTVIFLIFFINIENGKPIVSEVFAKEKTALTDSNVKIENENNNTVKIEKGYSRRPDKIIVDQNGNGDFLIIREALKVAEPGDIVVIYPGVYYESELLLNNPKDNLIITGIDKETVILDGGGAGWAVDTEDSTNLLIKNITFRNYHDGILLNLDNNISIENSIFKDNIYHGVFGIFAGSLNIAKNIFINNSRGLEFFNSGSSSKNVFDNAFYNNSQHGIAQYLTSNVEYRHNYLEGHPGKDNGSTVLISDSSNTMVRRNLINGNRGALGLLVYPEDITTSYNSFLNSSIIHIFVGSEPSELSFFENYYDDYTGEDANGDGLGDTPYIIDAEFEDSLPIYNKIPFALFTTNTTYTDQTPAVIKFTSHGADYTDIEYMEWYFDDGPTLMKSSVLRLWRYEDGRSQIQYFSPETGGQTFASWVPLSFNTLKPSLYGVPEEEFTGQDGKLDYHYLFDPNYDFYYELNPKHIFIERGVYNTTFEIESANNVWITSDSDEMQIVIEN